MKPATLSLDLLRTYPDNGTSVKTIMSTGLMFGFSENLMRVSLSRLVAKDVLGNFKRGYYRLNQSTDPINDFIERWRLGEKRRRPWSGEEWVCALTVASLPDKGRWALESNGFKMIEAQLWIRPDNLQFTGHELEQNLQQLGMPAATVFMSGTHLAPHIQERWLHAIDIEALDRGYELMRRQLEKSLRRLACLPIQTAKKESFHLGGEAILILAKDPLVPDQYQSAANRQRLFEVMNHYDREGRRIWATRSDTPAVIPTRRLEAIQDQIRLHHRTH